MSDLSDTEQVEFVNNINVHKNYFCSKPLLGNSLLVRAQLIARREKAWNNQYKMSLDQSTNMEAPDQLSAKEESFIANLSDSENCQSCGFIACVCEGLKLDSSSDGSNNTIEEIDPDEDNLKTHKLEKKKKKRGSHTTIVGITDNPLLSSLEEGQKPPSLSDGINHLKTLLDLMSKDILSKIRGLAQTQDELMVKMDTLSGEFVELKATTTPLGTSIAPALKNIESDISEIQGFMKIVGSDLQTLKENAKQQSKERTFSKEKVNKQSRVCLDIPQSKEAENSVVEEIKSKKPKNDWEKLLFRRCDGFGNKAGYTTEQIFFLLSQPTTQSIMEASLHLHKLLLEKYAIEILKKLKESSFSAAFKIFLLFSTDIQETTSEDDYKSDESQAAGSSRGRNVRIDLSRYAY